MANFSKILPQLEHIDIELTKDCNLDCIHCSARLLTEGKELSDNDIKKILQEAKPLGLRKVGFTGGEPFLSEKTLLELVNFCRDKLGTSIHIHSNGILISPETARWIKQLGVNITIKFYGSNSKTHDAITQTKGSMKSALKGLQRLLNADANVSVFIVPMKPNLQEIIPLIRSVYKKGCKDNRILSLSPTGKALEKFDELALSDNEILFLNEEFIKTQKEMDIDLNAGFCTRLSYPTLKIRKDHELCHSADNRVHIDAFGNIFPCTAASGRIIFSAGNLLMPGYTLSGIWKSSPLFQFIRRFHSNPPEKCQNCGVYSECMGGCRVMMSYKYSDVTIADPDCRGPVKISN